MNPAVTSLLVLLVVTIVMLTDKLPITTVAMVGALVCCVLGMYEFSKIFSSLGSTTIVLLFGLSIIGAAMFKSGLAKAIATRLLRMTGGSKRGVLIAIMLTSALLSMLCSNFAVVVMMIPMVKSISKEADMSLKHTMFPLCMGAAFGGSITLIGTTSNVAGNGVLEAVGLPLMGMFDVAWVGIPMAIVGMLWMCTVGFKLLPKVEGGYDGDPNEELDVTVTKSKRKMITTAVIVVITVIAMAVSSTALFVACLVGALLLILTGCISEKEAYKSLDWNCAMLIVSFTVIATSVSNAGGDQLIADWFVSVVGQNASPVMICGALFLLCAVITNFMSNQVTVLLMAPIAVTIANAIGVNPFTMVMVVVLAANACFATPVGAPPFTLIMPVAGYKYKDYVRMGLPLVIINFILATVIVPLVWAF